MPTWPTPSQHDILLWIDKTRGKEKTYKWLSVQWKTGGRCLHRGRKLFIIKSIKRELQTRPIYDCRCDERLKPKDNESTCLTYTESCLLKWSGDPPCANLCLLQQYIKRSIRTTPPIYMSEWAYRDTPPIERYTPIQIRKMTRPARFSRSENRKEQHAWPKCVTELRRRNLPSIFIILGISQVSS